MIIDFQHLNILEPHTTYNSKWTLIVNSSFGPIWLSVTVSVRQTSELSLSIISVFTSNTEKFCFITKCIWMGGALLCNVTQRNVKEKRIQCCIIRIVQNGYSTDKSSRSSSNYVENHVPEISDKQSNLFLSH